MTSKAKLVLSFDLELGWGAIENGLWRRRQFEGVYERTREALGSLLPLMDSLEVPATWAFVGGLLERPGAHDLSHLPDTARERTEKALEQGDEGTFYGADLVEAVAGARVGHEMACHTYSHVRVDHPGADAAFLRADLERFGRAFPEGSGLVTSFVFPSNREDFVEELPRAGFAFYRGEGHIAGDLAGGRPRQARAARLLEAALRTPPLSEVVEVRPGLKRASASVFFNSGYQRPYRLPFVRLRALRGLRAAVESGGALHVWNHPFNFGESSGLLRAYAGFLRRAVEYRDKGRLEIRVMAGL